MNLTLKRFVISCSLILALAIVVVPAHARDITVCAAGCEFDSIQTALTAANPAGGDTIRVGAGIFVGPVQVGINVDIVGINAAVSVVGGGIIVGGVGISVKVQNLTLTQGLNGLAVLGLSNVIAQDLTIANNISDGILASDFANVTLFNVTVANNGLNVLGNPIGAGISLNGAATLTTSVVTVTGNVSAGIAAFGNSTLNLDAATQILANGVTEGIVPGFGGEGVVVAGTATANIDGATVSGNGAAGIAVLENATADIRNSTVEGNNGAGIRVGGPASVNPDFAATASANIENNQINGNGSHGILVGDPAKVLETGTATISSNGMNNNGGCGLAIDVSGGSSATTTVNFASGNAEGDTCEL